MISSPTNVQLDVLRHPFQEGQLSWFFHLPITQSIACSHIVVIHITDDLSDEEKSASEAKGPSDSPEPGAVETLK
jgi:hypothetical protein